MAKSKSTKIAHKVGETFTTESLMKACSENAKSQGMSLSNQDIANAYKLIKDSVMQGISLGQKIQLTGFMTIEPSYRSARKGNNVVTGKPIDIPETIVLNVKAGKQLKDTAKALPADTMKALKKVFEDKSKKK